MKEILFLGFFNFCVKLVLFMGRHQLLPLPRGQDSGTFYNFTGVIFEIPGAEKDTVCLMTSAHLSNFHHDECIFFLITQLPKNKRKLLPKLLKVHINRIQLYLYSSSPRNKCKAKP